jgi:hypothetical protein
MQCQRRWKNKSDQEAKKGLREKVLICSWKIGGGV